MGGYTSKCEKKSKSLHPSAYVHQMFQKIQNNTLSSLFRGVGAGRSVYIPRNRSSVRVRFWKTTRRDRARVCAKFEGPRWFRGSNMNHKKKARRCRGLALDQRWAAILKNVSVKGILIHNFWEKNRIKRYNFEGQSFFHRWSDRKNRKKVFLHWWSDRKNLLLLVLLQRGRQIEQCWIKYFENL